MVRSGDPAEGTQRRLADDRGSDGHTARRHPFLLSIPDRALRELGRVHKRKLNSDSFFGLEIRSDTNIQGSRICQHTISISLRSKPYDAEQVRGRRI